MSNYKFFTDLIEEMSRSSNEPEEGSHHGEGYPAGMDIY
jgi:hypothetical protein